MKKFYILSVLAILFVFQNTNAQSFSLATNNPASTPSGIVAGSLKNSIYEFNIYSSSGGMLTTVSFTTSGGTYAATDVANFKLWYNTSINQLIGATQIGTTITATLGNGAHSFSGMAQSINPNTSYFFITADLPLSATATKTILVSTFTSANVTFSTGTVTGSGFPGGNQTIIGPTLTAGSAGSTNVNCFGGNTGTLAVSAASGGTAPYTYTWSGTGYGGGGQGTTNATGLAAGTYTCTIHDAFSGSGTYTGTITQPAAALGATPTNTNVSPCFGGSNGTIYLTSTGGTGPYTYSGWTPAPASGTTNTVSGLPANTYTVTITDTKGCTYNSVNVITQPAQIVPAPTVVNVACGGTSTGIITVNPTNGIGTYTYSWSPIAGATSQLNSVAAGSYTCNIKDGNGCSINSVNSVTQPAMLSPGSVSSTNVTCYNACNGTATALPALGGTVPYTYSWHPSGGAALSASALCPGSYTCFISDNHGCNAMSANLTITQPATALAISPSQVNIQCGGGTNGSATAAGSGGTAPYTYSWSPLGGTGSTATNLPAGIYTCTLTDASNCTVTQVYTLTQPPVLVATVSGQTNISCFGACSGSGSITPSGGTPGYYYSWSPTGGASNSASGLCPGTYTCTLTDMPGCIVTKIFIITQPTQLLTAVAPIDVKCFGACNGSITSNVTGGTTPYTYSWNPAGGTAANPTNLCPNTYSLYVSDANGCNAMGSAGIAQPAAALTIVPTQANISCFGGSNGSATASPNGGTSPYAYNWVPAPGSGQGTSVANLLSAGTYTCTVTDNRNCTAVQTYVITQGTAIVVTPTQSTIACFGGTATATAAVSGGSPSYTYNWVPAPGTGQGTTNAGGLTAGTYTFTAKDMLNCTAAQTFVITTPAQLVANVTSTNVSCNGAANGSGLASPTGGTIPYVYSWTPTAGTGATLAGLTPNSYTCTVTDNHGCTVNGSASVTQPTAIAIAPTQVNILCGGTSTGSATATASGGTPGYTYTWSPAPGAGQGTLTATGLSSGTYTCTVTDATGCTTNHIYSITSPSVITTTPTQVNNVCFGGSAGTATVTAAGGSPTYTYVWAPAPGGGQGTITATGLVNSNYTVTVKDANNCSVTQTYSISSPPPITAAPTSTNLTCNGTCNGTIVANVAGGFLPYTYSWSNGATTATVSGLCAGTYSCTALDNHGCSVVPTATLTQPSALIANPTSTIASCGSSNGTATMTASGGTGPGTYTYSWSQGGVTSTITALAPGTYSCTVRDANNCSAIQPVNVSSTSAPVLTIAPANVTCNGACNGSAIATPSGGAPAYTYSWSPSGGTTSSASGLCAGNYTCHVTDQNGCTGLSTASVTQPAALGCTASSTPATCGSSNGTATAAPSGGVTPYTYSWSGTGATTVTTTGLVAGTYTCTVHDSHNCIATSIATVTNTGGPALSEISHTDVSCNGTCNGSSGMSVSGGTTPYTYNWSPSGGNAVTATGLCANSYTCTVTDFNGCISTMVSVIVQPTALSASLVPTPITCNGSCNGSVASTVSGGTSPYTYSWSPSGGTVANITGLCAGNYTCTISDHAGCSTMPTAIITQPAALVASSVSQTNPVCNGNASGSAQVGAAGGNGAYTYSWTGGVIGGGQGTSTATTLAAGTYTCTVHDANNCSASNIFILTQPTAIALNITPVQAMCNGQCNGSASAIATGGVGTYAFSWSPNGSTVASASGLCTGVYTCTVSDNSGCVASQTTIIAQPIALNNTLTSINSSCGSSCTGSIASSPSGGTGAFTFSWSSSGQTTATATGLCAGTYTCTLTDNNGCIFANQANLTAPLSPIITGKVVGANTGAVINNGWAYLVQYDSILKKQRLLDSVTLSTAGRYQFIGEPGGKYLIYVIADPIAFPLTAKTYAPNADQWMNGLIINAPCGTQDSTDIAVIELAALTGAGSFTGSVHQGSGYGARLIVGTPAILGEPIPGLDVNLEQHPNGIVATTTTDISGIYHFSNVPAGTYNVYVDIPGLGNISQYTKTVTSNQMFTNLDYIADSTHIYPDTVLVIAGINAPIASPANRVSLSPNPFRDQISVGYTLSSTSDVVIEIYTMLGERVAGFVKPHQDAGTYSFKLNAAENNLSQGVYLFRMTKEGQTYTSRIVSIR